MSLKTVFKVVRYTVVGGLSLGLAGAALVYGLSSHKLQRKYAIQAREFPIAASAAVIERGRHVVATRGCADCHGSDFGGRKVIDDPLAGEFHGPNLTRGPGGLASDYQDADFVRAIRHGVGQNGRALALMPSAEYAQMSDEDLGAMIAYLKTLPAVDRQRGPVSPGPLVRVLMVLDQFKLSAEEIDHAAVQPSVVTPAISAEYGKYLASSCTGCHGPNLSGGKIPGAPPDWPAASNLTPHDSAAVRQWTEAQFMHALRNRERPDGTKLNPVMPAAFAQMNDLELKALWAYVSQLDPVPMGAR